MADPQEDFAGYMDNLKAAEEADREHQKMIDEHEVSSEKKMILSFTV